MSTENNPQGTAETPAEDQQQHTETVEQEVAEQPADTPQEPTADDTEAQQDDETTALKRARNEAAKYRVAAREATERAEALQTDLDAGTDRHQALQDALLHHMLSGHRVSLAAFKAAGHNPADFINDDGSTDDTALTAAVAQVGQQFGQQPKTNTEIAREEYSQKTGMPLEFLTGNTEPEWNKQTQAFNEAIISRIPSPTPGYVQPDRDETLKDQLRFMAHYGKKYNIHPDVIAPGWDDDTQPDSKVIEVAKKYTRPGASPWTGSGNPSNKSQASSWSDVLKERTA